MKMLLFYLIVARTLEALSQCCHTQDFRATLGPCPPVVWSVDGRGSKRVKQRQVLPCRLLNPRGLGRREKHMTMQTKGRSASPLRHPTALSLV